MNKDLEIPFTTKTFCFMKNCFCNVRKAKQIFALHFFLFLSVSMFAQKTVTGIVRENGNPVTGATVQVQGTNVATQTNATGSFSINVPAGRSVLVVSFVGMQTQEVDIANVTNVDVNLIAAVSSLNEVVVTALGISRQKKALGYSSQSVNGDELTKARETNILNSLSGKIAGVQINKTGNGPAGSTRIVIRGNNFLSENNQPLIVVDGIPLDNFAGATGQSEYGSFDSGNGLSELNPDDVESINVLKGPAASALYGIRGGNGVLVITTKKGFKRRGLGVRVNSNVTAESPLLYPDLQNVYGQGSDAVFNVKSQSSWGPKATGQPIVDWTGQSRPMTIDPDDLKKFLQTGLTSTTSVDLSGGAEKTNFRLGYSNMYNKGILPNSTLRRDFASLNLSSQVTNAFSVGARISYTKQNTHNRPQVSGSPSNIFAGYITMPRSVHLSDMNPYEDKNGAMILWQPEFYSTLRNPYWVLYKDFNRDESDRILTMVSAEYRFTSWLKLQVRNGMDMRQAFAESANAYGIRDLGSGALNFNSGYNASRSRAVETNTDFLAVVTKSLKDWSGTLSVGGNRLVSKYNSVSGSTGLLDLPGVYTLSSGSLPRPSSYKSEFRINSLYAFLNIGFRNYLFADFTFRNDWVSVLAKDKRSFHYPSVSFSAIVSDFWSDLFKSNLPEFITFAKLRAAYAEAGSVTISPYQLTPTFDISRGYGDLNILVTSPPRVLVDPNIKPGLVKSQEYGVELRFLKNRLGLDFTYYTKDGVNQILFLPLPGATGFSTAVINAGKIRNKGYEFTISGSPIRTENLEWKIAINYNHNENRVLKLDPRQKTYALQGDIQSRAIRIMANEGEDYGNIYGRDFAKDDKGNIIVETDGTPRKSESKNVLLGNFQAKYTAGIENTLTYKNINFSFLIDIRKGGKFYSQSQAYMHSAGTSKETLANREGGLVVNGVLAAGGVNTKAITAQQYWDKVSGAEPVASLFIYDASNVRLREVVLGYNVPNKIWGKIPVRNVSVNLVGRNLWLISSHIPGIDPESSFSTTNAQGWENGAYPSTRSYGASVKVEF